MTGTAVIDGPYRYLLTRDLGADLSCGNERALFVMLNPSTADAMEDDPTIRRCKGFARAWDCRHLEVVNLYALRTPSPRVLFARQAGGEDVVGPGNDEAIGTACRRADIVVAAWGAFAEHARVAAVLQLAAAAQKRLLCLGVTKLGAPRHPLYVRAEQAPQPWAPRAHA